MKKKAMFYVYIIQSIPLEIYYKGFTMNMISRLNQHNANRSRYTSGKGPWKLVFIQVYESKKEALIREKSLKKYSRLQIKELINSHLNEL